MKRDVSVEFARIIACLMVIGIHISLNIYHDGYFDASRLGFACIVADAVGVFWLILGFFLFLNTSYKKLIRKTIVNIGVPTLLFSIFAFYFGEWIAEGVPLNESILHSFQEYVDVLKELLKWNSPVKYGGHLWYIYVYMLIILIYPVLKATVNYLDEKVERQKIFMLMTMGAFLLNDISRNQLFQFSHHSINALVPASVIVIWGNIIYKRKEDLVTKRNLLLSVLAFIGFNMMRTIFQLYFYHIEAGDNILFWYSSIGVLCAACVVIFAFCIENVIVKIKHLGDIINFFASHTFNIYLLHFMIIYVLRRISFQDKLYNWMPNEILYMCILVIVVFTVSFFASVGLRMFGNICRKLINKGVHFL